MKNFFEGVFYLFEAAICIALALFIFKCVIAMWT
nr:MAG TPA: hypothetical protein [Bacteriophage sp.]